MDDAEGTTAAPNADDGANESEREKKLTPELVRQVADRVYELWRRDLQIEQERRRIIHNHKWPRL